MSKPAAPPHNPLRQCTSTFYLPLLTWLSISRCDKITALSSHNRQKNRVGGIQAEIASRHPVNINRQGNILPYQLSASFRRARRSFLQQNSTDQSETFKDRTQTRGNPTYRFSNLRKSNLTADNTTCRSHQFTPTTTITKHYKLPSQFTTTAHHVAP